MGPLFFRARSSGRLPQPVLFASPPLPSPSFAQITSASDVTVWAGEVPGSPFRLVRGQCMVNSTERELLATMTLPDDGAVNRTLRTVDETFTGGVCVAVWWLHATQACTPESPWLRASATD